MTGRSGPVAVAVVAVLVASACGSRIDHDRIVAAWEAGNVPGSAPAPSRPAGDVSMPAGPSPVQQASSAAAAAPSTTGTGTGTGSSSAPVRPSDPANGGRNAAASSSAGASSANSTGDRTGAAPRPGLPAPGAAPGGPGGGAGPAGAVERAEIVIGSVGTVSGPIGGAIAGGVRAAQAWVSTTNAKGGIDGHRLRFVVADDGADPARHRALLQQLVEQQKVVVFVYNAAPISGQAGVPYLEQQQVAALGTEGGNPWVNASPMYFPQMSSFTYLADVFAGPVAQEARKDGKTKLALFNCEFASCKPVLTAAAFRAAGMNVVHEATASITQPDYTAECLAARNAGAEVLFPQMAPDGITRFVESCRNVGFTPLYAFEAQTMSNLFLQRPELEGAIFSSPVAPFFLDRGATNEFRSAMAKYAPRETVNVSAQLGWVAAKLLERALVRISAARIAPADILGALWSVQGDDLDGTTYPLSFERGAKNNAVREQSCWWTIRIRQGQWTTPDGGQRRCRAA